jgi:hypothetical protein
VQAQFVAKFYVHENQLYEPKTAAPLSVPEPDNKSSANFRAHDTFLFGRVYVVRD